MSKIVIDARIINSSTGRYVERLLYYLQKIDKINKYIVLINSDDKDYWKPSARNFSTLFCDIKNYSLDEQIKFKKILEKIKPDLVHFCMPQQPIFYKGNKVTTFHDLTLLKTYNEDKNWLVFHIKQLIGRFIFLVAAKKSNLIMTPTNFTKKEVIEFANIPENKIYVTYEAADIKKDEAKDIKLPFSDFILYVGKQSTYKNIRRLAEAHQKLLDKHPDLWLILANPKDKAVLQNEDYFNKNGYKNIYFFGRAYNQDLAWLYPHCKAYVFPSLMEGFGLPGLEAMGLGAPVVSSNATCLPEVYGDAAVYFDPNNTDDMVNKIDQVLSDKELRNDLIQKGYKQLAKYSWERTARQTHSVYMDALKSKIS